MQKKLGHQVACQSIAFLPWFVLAGVTGCGDGGGSPSPLLPEPSVDAGVGPALPLAPRLVANPPNIDAGGAAAEVTDGAPVDSRSSLPEASAPRCVPEGGVDEPDDAFADTNCDGIDGDAERAVFVATTGSDSGAGTKDEPFRSLGRAVTAAGRDKGVYVCNGEYAENVRIEGDGARIYGGYDCEHGWQRGTDRARIAPSSGVPLGIADVPDAVVVDRLALIAPNANTFADGTSSVPLTVLRSADVLIRRSVLRAGDAARGADGASAGPTPDQPIAMGGNPMAAIDCVGTLNGALLQGSPQDCLTVSRGGYGDQRQCKSGVFVRGGPGGDGANLVRAVLAQRGGLGIPASGAGSTKTGADGTPGDQALFGFGKVERGTYVPTDGLVGSDGDPGRAGVGGKGGDSIGRGDFAITYWIGGGGGQGGYPGCGGSGGNPGKGGGGSFAILSDASHVRVERSVLETGRGGDGGNGSEGAPGQRGGAGGLSGTGSGGDVTNGQPGEAGGNGGHGGAGGPGAGGPSAGIVWTGTPPSVDAVTFVLGTPGLGGVTSARIGAEGVVAEIHPPVPAGDAGQGGTP